MVSVPGNFINIKLVRQPRILSNFDEEDLPRESRPASAIPYNLEVVRTHCTIFSKLRLSSHEVLVDLVNPEPDTKFKRLFSRGTKRYCTQKLLSSAIKIKRYTTSHILSSAWGSGPGRDYFSPVSSGHVCDICHSRRASGYI